MVVVILTAVLAAALLATALVKRTRDQREMERHSITPEALHVLLASNQNVLLFDVRQPLDLLGDSVIIPGARWLAPQEILENPSLIPREKDLVVYCTCPSAKISRAVLRQLSRWDCYESSSSRVAWMAGEQEAFRSSLTTSPSISTRAGAATPQSQANFGGRCPLLGSNTKVLSLYKAQ